MYHQVLQVVGKLLAFLFGFSHQYGGTDEDISNIPFFGFRLIFVGFKTQHVGGVVLVPEVPVKPAPFLFTTKAYCQCPRALVLVFGVVRVNFQGVAHSTGCWLAQVRNIRSLNPFGHLNGQFSGGLTMICNRKGVRIFHLGHPAREAPPASTVATMRRTR